MLLLLFLLPSSSAQPASWLADIARADKLYTPNDAQIPPQQLPLLGNGYFGMQHMDDSLWVSGIFNGHATGNGFGPSRRAQLPSSLTAAPVLAPGAPSHAAWDVRTATYYRRSYLNASGTCESNSNVSCAVGAGVAWVEQRWYAHFSMPHLLVLEVELLPGDEAVAPASGVGAYLRLVLAGGDSQGDINFTSPARASPAPDAPLLTTGWTQLGETPATPLVRVGILASNLSCATTAYGVWPVSVGAPLTFLTAVRSSIETSAGGIEAALADDFAAGTAAAAAGALWAPHAAAWAGAGGLWDAGFEIAGRPDVAAAANASFAAILASVRPGRDFGISPAGITSGWYYGHVFWDQDFWMLPPLALTHPELAAGLLNYRLAHLPQSLSKAAQYGFAGAMFPWQSGSSGVETCPSYASYGIVREIHLNGDIAAAVKLVWAATGDIAWLNATGWPLLREVAVFFVSRLAHDNPGGLNGTAPLHLLDVCGPDEEHDHVSDSVFTNAVASLALLAARDAALALGLAPDPAWADAAGRIVLPTNATAPGGGPFNNSGDYHPEFANYTGAVVKQADVVLLGFPLGLPMPSTTRANDLEVYAARTDPGGPAMTWSMYSIGFCELGTAYEDAAATFFNKSFANNVQAPFAVWKEGGRGGGCPNFLTGAGGFLQALLHGYSGMRVNASALTFTNPRMPEGASAVKLRGLAYRGSRLSIALDAATASMSVEVTGVAPGPSGGGGPPPALQLTDATGGVHPLAPGVPVALPLQSVAVRVAAR